MDGEVCIQCALKLMDVVSILHHETNMASFLIIQITFTTHQFCAEKQAIASHGIEAYDAFSNMTLLEHDKLPLVHNITKTLLKCHKLSLRSAANITPRYVILVQQEYAEYSFAPTCAVMRVEVCVCVCVHARV